MFISKSVSALDTLFVCLVTFVSLLYCSILPLLYLVPAKLVLNAKATFHMCLKSTQLLKGAAWGHLSVPAPDVPYTESGN